MPADQYNPPFKEQKNPARIRNVRRRFLKPDLNVNSDLFIRCATIITDREEHPPITQITPTKNRKEQEQQAGAGKSNHFSFII